MPNKVHVKKGDTVVVLSGREGLRKQTGKVLAVDPKKGTVRIEGLNMIKRSVKPNPRNPQGGFVESEGWLNSSKVMPICPSCEKPTRVRHKKITGDDGKDRHIRVCAKCEGALDSK